MKPVDLYSMTLAMIQVIEAGGLGMGGMNFDAKVRRQSSAPEDLVHAHVGGVDLCARAFLAAAKIVEDGKLKAKLDARYAGWQQPENQAMLAGGMTLDQIAAKAEAGAIYPEPRSGEQEQYENLITRYL